MDEMLLQVDKTQENRCRVCLEITESTICLQNPANIEETLSYWDVLRLICRIETDDNETTPQIICAACSDRAEVAYEFKVMCENSDKMLQSELTANNSNFRDGITVEFLPTNIEYGNRKITTDLYHDKSTHENESEFDFTSDISINSCTSYNQLNCVGMVVKDDFTIKKNTKDSVDLKPKSTPEKENKILTHDEIIAPNTCKICKKTYKYGYNLKRHMARHEGIKKYKCNECGMGFVQRNAMITHKQSHTNERTYDCKECKASFKVLTHLNRHVIAVHKKVKQYPCTVCPLKFATQYRVDRHVNQVHLDVRNHKCDICDKSFAFKAYLKKHEGVHTGDRPFSCEICKKKFKYAYSVDRHMKLCHSGKRGYSCEVCGKTFKYAYSVNRHMSCHFD